MAKIQPRSTPTTEPYWEGCRMGELRLQYCAACDRYQFYPRITFTECPGEELQWRNVSGAGVVASYTVVRRGLTRDYDAPYVVILVDLDEGPRMMSQLIDCDPEQVAVGDRVQVEFQDWGDDIAMPVFRKQGGN